jgi:hypothetical protein
VPFPKYEDPLRLSIAGDKKAVYDPLGNHVLWQSSPQSNPPPFYPRSSASFGSLGSLWGNAQESSCQLDGIPTNCDLAMSLLNNGSAMRCRDNDCGPRFVRTTNAFGDPISAVSLPFLAFGDGSFGSFFGGWSETPQEQAAALFAQVTLIDGVRHGNNFGPQNPVEFLQDHTSRSSYGPGKENEIKRIVDRMTNDSCTKAFESAGLTSPKTLLGRGVVIGPASLLADSSRENLNYMGITEFARQRDVGVYSSGTNRAVTIRDHPNKIPDTVDGRPRIFLNASAFGSDLGDYVRHEFIHAGGATARTNHFGSDLYWLGYGERTIYVTGRLHAVKEPVKVGTTEDDILKACR